MITQSEIAAGCVVLRDGATEPEVLLIWVKQYPDPILPKGHVEADESNLAAALREVKEETGYDVECISPVPVTLETILDNHPPIVRKVIHWYAARVLGGSPDKRTETQLVSRVGWLPISEALAQMRRRNEIQAIESIMQML